MSTRTYTDSACASRLERIPTLVYALSVDDGGCIPVSGSGGGGGSSMSCVDGAPVRFLYDDAQCRGSVIGSELVQVRCEPSAPGPRPLYRRLECAPAPTQFVARLIVWSTPTCTAGSSGGGGQNMPNQGGVEYIGIGETSTCAANLTASGDSPQATSISCAGTTLTNYASATCSGTSTSVQVSESMCTVLPDGTTSLRGTCFDALPTNSGGSSVGVIVGASAAAGLVAFAVVGYFWWRRRKTQAVASETSAQVDAVYTSLQGCVPFV